MEEMRITLEAARVNAGLTQKEACEKLKISNQTLIKWEKGITEPTISQARKLSEIYGMPLEHIFLPCKSN